jgi:GH15 family glucan-1,4-alpha-glucosidase
MNHKDLYQRSIEIIKKYQDQAGSYIASPNFEVYAYCWLRDGSYTAAAMDAVGEHSSARAFHTWVGQVIRRYRHKIVRIQQALESGQILEDQDFLFTRYSLDGYEDMTDESWGNFQYDGYGTWLWALNRHYQVTGDRQLVADVWQSVQDVVDYLSLVWRLPSYDCWEEHPELLHPYSLSCAYGGMQAALALAEDCDLPLDCDAVASEAEKIRRFTLDNGVCEGVVVKHIYPETAKNPYCQSSIDSNLLGLIYPYQMVEPDSDLGQAILNEIRNDLISVSGGVHRYFKDTYYGGGTWILLTAWLGWVEMQMGDIGSAQTRLDWIADKADGQGWLPEQIVDEVLFPEMVDPWVSQRGPVANPLLWSHAMYLILNENMTHQKGEV